MQHIPGQITHFSDTWQNADVLQDGKAVGQNGYGGEEKDDAAERRADISHIIIDCSTMGYLDWTGMTTLREVCGRHNIYIHTRTRTQSYTLKYPQTHMISF